MGKELIDFAKYERDLAQEQEKIAREERNDIKKRLRSMN